IGRRVRHEHAVDEEVAHPPGTHHLAEDDRDFRLDGRVGKDLLAAHFDPDLPAVIADLGLLQLVTPRPSAERGQAVRDLVRDGDRAVVVDGNVDRHGTSDPAESPMKRDSQYTRFRHGKDVPLRMRSRGRWAVARRLARPNRQTYDTTRTPVSET